MSFTALYETASEVSREMAIDAVLSDVVTIGELNSDAGVSIIRDRDLTEIAVILTCDAIYHVRAYGKRVTCTRTALAGGMTVTNLTCDF